MVPCPTCEGHLVANSHTQPTRLNAILLGSKYRPADKENLLYCVYTYMHGDKKVYVYTLQIIYGRHPSWRFYTASVFVHRYTSSSTNFLKWPSEKRPLCGSHGGKSCCARDAGRLNVDGPWKLSGDMAPTSQGMEGCKTTCPGQMLMHAVDTCSSVCQLCASISPCIECMIPSK